MRKEVYLLENEKTLVSQKLKELKPSELIGLYKIAEKRLTAKFRGSSQRTEKEDRFYEQLQSSTKLKIFRSIWIGSKNIDLFIPGLVASSNSCGLAIEINGDIHNHELKMKKDSYKHKTIEGLGVPIYTIENADLNVAPVKSFVEGLKHFKRSDSRAKQRLFQRIYKLTIQVAFTSEADLISEINLLKRSSPQNTDAEVFTIKGSEYKDSAEPRLFENQLLTYKQAAAYLSVSVSYLRELKGDRRIKHVMVSSRSVRFRKSALDSFIKEREI